MMIQSIKTLLIGFLCFCTVNLTVAQDTFSIVAVDTVTGEVGSAGASCVDLSAFSLPPDFLGELFPGVGAINTQAFYIEQNQINARNRMNAGDSPQEIIDWLIMNDIQDNPGFRQYGVVRIMGDSSSSAAHTGINTNSYKGDRTGPTYSIQGNILLGPEILDSMEFHFINTEGSLADKLMAAMQGANVAGADSRCLDNGTSSLFAFLKIAQPDDEFGSPSLVLGVDFPDNSGIEPIDSLQSLFDEAFPPLNTEELNPMSLKVYPNPAEEVVYFDFEGEESLMGLQLLIYDITGKRVFQTNINNYKTELHRSNLGMGNLYTYSIQSASGVIKASGKITFF